MEETTAAPAVGNEDLPALFRAADSASLAAQARYLQLIKIDLLLLVLGALCSSFSLSDPMYGKALSGVGAIHLGASLILTIVLIQKGYQKQWYEGRAMAESVKTLSWRFMTCAEPFQRSLTAEEADDNFIQSLKGILQQGEVLAITTATTDGNDRQITEPMRQLRAAPLDQRMGAYLTSRVADQRRWYSEKAAASSHKEDRLFILIVVAQALALTTAILQIVYPDTVFNPTGTLSATAAAVLAWLQVKQHQQLAQSYGIAAQELGLIAEQAPHVDGEKKFSTFVADSENAISREHTLWLARRDQIIRT